MTQSWPDASSLPTWPEESADFETMMAYIKACLLYTSRCV